MIFDNFKCRVYQIPKKKKNTKKKYIIRLTFSRLIHFEIIIEIYKEKKNSDFFSVSMSYRELLDIFIMLKKTNNE